MADSLHGLIPLGAAASAFLGLAWLALSMDTHWEQVHPRRAARPGTSSILRGLGGAAIVLSALLCFAADRASMAVLVWLMQLTVAIPVLALLLAYRPAWLRALWPGAGPA